MTDNDVYYPLPSTCTSLVNGGQFVHVSMRAHTHPCARWLAPHAVTFIQMFYFDKDGIGTQTRQVHNIMELWLRDTA